MRLKVAVGCVCQWVLPEVGQNCSDQLLI